MRSLEEILQKKNVKPTAMRLLVLGFLMKRRGVAVSLSDIEGYFGKVQRTTLFRTIKKFSESDIVHRVDDGTGITKYALCQPGYNCKMETDLHLHFHCRKCGETVCFPNNKIPSFDMEEGFVAEEMSFVIKGVCKKCNDIAM